MPRRRQTPRYLVTDHTFIWLNNEPSLRVFSTLGFICSDSVLFLFGALYIAAVSAGMHHFRTRQPVLGDYA